MPSNTLQISTISKEYFYESWENIRTTFSTEKSEVERFFMPFIETMPKTALGEFYWQIFDSTKPFPKIIMVGGDVEKLTPNTAEELLRLPPEGFFSNFHPEDLTETLTLVTKMFAMLLEQSPANRKNFSFSIYTRVKNQHQYCWNCLQYPALYFDQQDNLLFGLALYTNVNHLMRPDAKPMMTILDSTNKDTQIFSCVNTTKVITTTQVYPSLTKREREIIALLAQGKASKQIGPILGIKKNTVDNHRQRLLKKFGVSSSSELVFKTVML
jgi:DNA-binding CsgD family transcriptional regulator